MENKHIPGVIGFQSNHSKNEEFAPLVNNLIRNLDLKSDYVKVAFCFFAEDAHYRKSAQETAVEIGAPMIEPLVQLLSAKILWHKAEPNRCFLTLVQNQQCPIAQEQKKM